MRGREKVNIYNATWSLFSSGQAAIFIQTFSSITVTICLEEKHIYKLEETLTKASL